MAHIESNPVTLGTIMVQNGLRLPEQFQNATATYSTGWQTVSGTDGFAFDRKLRLLGWGCFFLAGEVTSFSIGASQAGMVRAAAKRMLSKIRALDCNCAQFTKITHARFLGIPYVRMSGYARHVQAGNELDSARQRNQQQQRSDSAQQ